MVASLFAGSVQAHAHLEKSTPADGSTLSVAPAALEMTFSEAARLTALSIQSDREARLAIKELPAAVGSSLIVSLASPPLWIHNAVSRAASENVISRAAGAALSLLPSAGVDFSRCA